MHVGGISQICRRISERILRLFSCHSGGVANEMLICITSFLSYATEFPFPIFCQSGKDGKWRFMLQTSIFFGAQGHCHQAANGHLSLKADTKIFFCHKDYRSVAPAALLFHFLYLSIEEKKRRPEKMSRPSSSIHFVSLSIGPLL